LTRRSTLLIIKKFLVFAGSILFHIVADKDWTAAIAGRHIGRNWGQREPIPARAGKRRGHLALASINPAEAFTTNLDSSALIRY